ncbi:MAG TPA: sulfite exporter TauE/SafE family protein [Longimicrobium sp.]|nr:sulfite exporter TauE/SafE family protein [Longimicrobium sp.]
MMMLLAGVCAALIGLSLGLLGGGGSILTVPVFVYLLGFEAKEAIAGSLLVVGATSLFGAVGHWRAGNVNLRVAAVFGAVAMAGAYLGARLAAFVSGGAQLTLFAGVMLLAAWFMFRPSKAPRDDAAGGPVRAMPLWLIAAEGLGVGLLTGLVGVGGGFLIVPALVLLGRVPMKQAVGTSLLVIAMNSAAGFAGYWGRVTVAWGFLALFAAVAVAGILLGTRLSRRVPQHALRRAFAVLLLVMGSFVLYQNRGVLLPGPAAAARGSAPARGKVGGVRRMRVGESNLERTGRER